MAANLFEDDSINSASRACLSPPGDIRHLMKRACIGGMLTATSLSCVSEAYARCGTLRLVLVKATAVEVVEGNADEQRVQQEEGYWPTDITAITDTSNRDAALYSLETYDGRLVFLHGGAP
jgi:hypothetical protein